MQTIIKSIIAVNMKHQPAVNKAVRAMIRYNALNDMRDAAFDEGCEKLIRKYNKLCEAAFDKYLTIVSELPKREVANIESTELY